MRRPPGTPGPASVVTFRLSREHLRRGAISRAPFFRPCGFPISPGILIDARTDWDELDELLRGSYRVLAPKKLVARMADEKGALVLVQRAFSEIS